MKEGIALRVRKNGILKEMLSAPLPMYTMMQKDAFCHHHLLAAYIQNTLAGYLLPADQDLADLTVELLSPPDDAA